MAWVKQLSPFWMSDWRGRSKEEAEVEEEEAEFDMVSTISFIQANLQHSIAASRVLSRTVSVKGIDISLIQELWYHEGRIRGPEYSRIYLVLRGWNR